MVLRAASAHDTRISGNNAWYLHHTTRLVRELTAGALAAGVRAAERDLDFVLNQIPLTPRSRVLEIGCGWGRHTLALRARGFTNLVSIDISPAMLARARERAAAAGDNVDIRQLDFLDVAGEPPFEALLSLYDRSCLGFPSEEEDRHSLTWLRSLLVPGGYLLFGTGDWPARLPRPRRDWREWDGVVELLETVPDTATMTCTDRTTVLLDGNRRVYELTRRHYTLPEVHRLLAEGGFALRGVWHALDERRPYGGEREGLFVLASKEGR